MSIAEKPLATKPLIQASYCNIHYSSIQNLAEKPSKNKAALLPGLGIKGTKNLKKRQKQDSATIVDEPKLLTTAKNSLLEEQQYFEQINMNEALKLLGSFALDEDYSINNSLLNTNNQQRKRKNSTKTKLNSIASEREYEEHSKYKSSQFRVYDHIAGQSDVVYAHVFGRERSIDGKIIQQWKECLSHSDKTEVYLGDSDIPYSHPRFFPINEIEKGFREIYGTGKNRSLTVGEQAVIIDSIQKYLKLCSKDPMKITRKEYDIGMTILQDCKLIELENYPYCFKQIETHFKIMATKWRYSGELDFKDKNVETAVSAGRNNFVDLGKNSLLTHFLLKNSNFCEL